MPRNMEKVARTKMNEVMKLMVKRNEAIEKQKNQWESVRMIGAGVVMVLLCFIITNILC